MILETEYEREAFDFICELASELTSRRGCNDLPEDIRKKFESLGLAAKSSDTDGKVIPRPITYDFDILWWLAEQVR